MTDSDAGDASPTFAELALAPAVAEAVAKRGYTNPTPIQAAVIPHMLAGRDVLGQAQTGTGKTAAFALPLLSTVDPKLRAVQVLVLAPTRELANQVAEACNEYGRGLRGLGVLPVYGGQGYREQLSGLRRGAQVVVGTPGRVIDHLERGTLDCSNLRCLVLDEADEMLRMGFVDDVEKILEFVPDHAQTALFSATMPGPIRRIADQHLKDPEVVRIAPSATTAETIRQRAWTVSGMSKPEALARLLECEVGEGAIVFVRTRAAASELASELERRGFAAAGLSGDLAQAERERTVERLRNGRLDVLVATDVAARGLDVERIGHVINYDLPTDAEAYVHRIGRTGRAGRKGEAILFVHPRERRGLRSIERTIRAQIEPMRIPSADDLGQIRAQRLREKISALVAEQDPEDELLGQIVDEVITAHNGDALKIATALARVLRGERPLVPPNDPPQRGPRRDARDDRGPRDRRDSRDDRGRRGDRGDRGDRFGQRDDRGRDDRGQRDERPRPDRRDSRPEPGMTRYKVAVGRAHGTRPSQLVGAIANEAGLSGEAIGRIQLYDEFSTVELPSALPPVMLRAIEKAWVAGRQLRLSEWREHGPGRGGPRGGPRRHR